MIVENRGVSDALNNVGEDIFFVQSLFLFCNLHRMIITLTHILSKDFSDIIFDYDINNQKQNSKKTSLTN